MAPFPFPHPHHHSSASPPPPPFPLPHHHHPPPQPPQPPLLPLCLSSESLLYSLESYGPQAFAAALVGDSDTPEIIWTHRMRGQRLVPQVGMRVVGVGVNVG